jgi:hypothetical protein
VPPPEAPPPHHPASSLGGKLKNKTSRSINFFI